MPRGSETGYPKRPSGRKRALSFGATTINLELSARIGSVEQFKKMLTPLVKERLGVVVGAVTAEQAAAYGLPAPMGVTIQWLDPKGPLGKAGFEKGELILAIDRRPIDGVDAFLSIASRLSRNQKVILLALDHQSGQTSYVQGDGLVTSHREPRASRTEGRGGDPTPGSPRGSRMPTTILRPFSSTSKPLISGPGQRKMAPLTAFVGFPISGKGVCSADA